MPKVQRIHVTVSSLVVFLLLGVSAALAADLPKEGNYDITSCWSGASNNIAFSKTHTAASFELTGTTRSNPPGGPFAMISFRCVGMASSIEGKSTGMNLCELVDKDGDSFSFGTLSRRPSRRLKRSLVLASMMA
jgi:hypothetical protein